MARKQIDKRHLQRFAWFWYNDHEIFEATQEELDTKLAALAKQGITHVITFSNTHSRATFRPYFKEINECIGKIVKAAHKVGIGVTEHHSTTLIRNASVPSQKERLLYPECDPKNWTRLFEKSQLSALPVDWLQRSIDGQLFENSYHAYGLCFNNPDFVEDYKRYLEDVYRQGVDGIMTDDVQFMGWYYEICFCPHCRKKLKEEYGVDIPEAKDAKNWLGNLKDPSFLQYMRMRNDSVVQFHKTIKQHYESLGLSLYRPNYCSTQLSFNPTAYCLDELPALDCCFQECTHGSIIRYSWLYFLMENRHRTMMASLRSIPSMMMYYAGTNDELEFCFGLAHVAGGLFTNTPGVGKYLDESKIRAFEIKNAEYLFELTQLPTIGFIQSLENRFYGAGFEFSRLKFWMQSALFHNLPTALVDLKHPETWDSCSCLCVLDFHLISQEDIQALKTYAEQGGTLLLAGLTACQDETGKLRSADEIRSLLGMNPVEDLAEMEIRTIPQGKGKIVYIGPLFGFGKDLNMARDFLIDKEGLRFRAENEYKFEAKGLSYLPASKKSSGIWHEPEGRRESMRQVATFLQDFLAPNTLRCHGLPEGLIVTAWHTINNEIVLPMLNAVGTLDRVEGETYATQDPIPFPKLNGAAQFDLGTPLASALFRELNGTEAPLYINGSTIEMPLQLLKRFGLIIAK